MKKNTIKCFALVCVIFLLNACSKNEHPNNNSEANLDKLLIGTNISTSSPITGYVGTLKDLSVTNFTNEKSRQTFNYPYVSLYKNDVFVMDNLEGNKISKYTRKPDGTLAASGVITAPANSVPLGTIVESDSRAFCSLYKLGKILIFNPTTMTQTDFIDLRSYGLGGDGNPDPSVMALRNGKLYVACAQTSDGFTSNHPVQILIIDINDGNKIVSVTDNRTTWAGSVNEQKSIFFDETGDMYIYAVASYGFGAPGQKSGFLRIKNGATEFDPTYFFNTVDYTISGVPGDHVNYLQRMRYAGKGMLYASGNIYALNSNPPDYVNDRTYGFFKVDLRNKTISKIDVPYSNGMAASVGIFENKILFGIAGKDAVGIYTYDPITGVASKKPVVNTQGDPHQIEVF